jgi:ABC-type uncharacterized transport system permease subunit
MLLTFNLLLTLLIELPVVAFFFKRKVREHAVLTAFLVNIVTWPLVQVVVFSTDVTQQNFFLETAVILAEAIAYKIWLDCSWKKSFLMSAIANLMSYGAGILLKMIFKHFI